MAEQTEQAPKFGSTPGSLLPPPSQDKTVKFRCPNCRGVIFHKAEYVEIRLAADKQGTDEVPQFNEYRCQGCNSQLSVNQMVGFEVSSGNVKIDPAEYPGGPSAGLGLGVGQTVDAQGDVIIKGPPSSISRPE